MKKKDLKEYSSELIEVGEERRRWNHVKSFIKSKKFWFVLFVAVVVWLIDNEHVNIMHILKMM